MENKNPVEHRLFFEVEPIAKSRPRFKVNHRRGSVHTYNKPELVQYETVLATLAREQMRKLGLTPIKGPMGMKITFFFERPKSAQKRVHHTVKPDLDNLVKAVKDAFNEIVYIDDSQIIELQCLKVYDIKPGIEVFFWQIID